MWPEKLFASIKILYAISLVVEPPWQVEPFPAAILALVFICRRASRRITNVANAVVVKISLVSVRNERTIVNSIKDAVVVVVRIAAVANTIVIVVCLIGIGCERTIITGIGDAITIGVWTTGCVHLGVWRSVRTLVIGVGHTIAVIVCVNTIGLAIVVRVGEAFVDVSVAVIVQAVANFSGAGMNAGVRVIAIRVIDDITTRWCRRTDQSAVACITEAIAIRVAVVGLRRVNAGIAVVAIRVVSYATGYRRTGSIAIAVHVGIQQLSVVAIRVIRNVATRRSGRTDRRTVIGITEAVMVGVHVIRLRRVNSAIAIVAIRVVSYATGYRRTGSITVAISIRIQQPGVIAVRVVRNVATRRSGRTDRRTVIGITEAVMVGVRVIGLRRVNSAIAIVDAPQTYYADTDHDGFGDPNNST